MAHSTRRPVSLLLAAAAAAVLLAGGAPAQAAPLAPTGLLNAQASDASDVSQVAVVVRRGVAVGPRGGVYGYRSATVVRPGAWVRPPDHHWGAGGAVAAGAALGFIAAATATAYATSPAPAPGMCWYYTDASRHAGFWDYCP